MLYEALSFLFYLGNRRRTRGRCLNDLLRGVGGMEVNAGKSKVIVLNGEEGLECKVHVDGIYLEHISEFK